MIDEKETPVEATETTEAAVSATSEVVSEETSVTPSPEAPVEPDASEPLADAPDVPAEVSAEVVADSAEEHAALPVDSPSAEVEPVAESLSEPTASVGVAEGGVSDVEPGLGSGGGAEVDAGGEVSEGGDASASAEAVAAEAVVAEPVKTEPVVVAQVVSEPVVAEPVVAEPVAAEQVVAAGSEAGGLADGAGEVVAQEVAGHGDSSQSAAEPLAADAGGEALAESPSEPAGSTQGVVGSGPRGAGVSDEDLFAAAMASLAAEEASASTGGPSGLTKGERIEAKVIQVENDRVFVDLGTKAEGIVPLNELTSENVSSAIGVVQPGDTFEVIVLRTHSAEGNAVVSKRRADFDVQWQKIIDSFEAGEVFQANVIDRVKGGLVVDIGVRGFVPATHVGSGKLRNIEKYVGQVLPVKIIEVDKERRKVVLSNKAAEDERRGEVKDRIFQDTKPGDVLEGTVRRLTDYGAFVDLGGIDGLLHISEMSWVRIDHPKEVLREGDDIKVMVLRLDEGGGRISLGLRQVLPDPWNLIRENYQLGQRIKVTVSRMVQSGAFVKLPEGAEAFLPLSEVSEKRLKRPQDELEDGQEIEPMIIDLRPDERRMVLSLRENASPGQYRYDPSMGQRGFGAGRDQGGGQGRDQGGMGVRRRPAGGPGGKRRESDYDAAPAQRAPTGGATIGERLGLLKGLMRPDAGGTSEPAAEKAPDEGAPGE